jgi:ribokinase
MDLVRDAVAELKRTFAAAGNHGVEVLVTLGQHGSMHFGSAWKNDDSFQHETPMGTYALSEGSIFNATGAGDCFRGSYVAARYGEGKNLVESLRWAAAAASLSVEVVGALPSMPDRRAVDARFMGKDTKFTASALANLL